MILQLCSRLNRSTSYLRRASKFGMRCSTSFILCLHNYTHVRCSLYSVGWIGTGIMGASMCEHLMVRIQLSNLADIRSVHWCLLIVYCHSRRILAMKPLYTTERFRSVMSYEKRVQEWLDHLLKLPKTPVCNIDTMIWFNAYILWPYYSMFMP